MFVRKFNVARLMAKRLNTLSVIGLSNSVFDSESRKRELDLELPLGR